MTTMASFADYLRQQRADEWNTVMRFLDACDWMRLEYRGRAYRAQRVLADEELSWFESKNIPVELLETHSVDPFGMFGMHRWHQNGRLHRDGDQPAIIWANGTQSWYQNGLCHRDGDQPAILWADGTQEWCQNGQRHRAGDQPAIVGANGRQEWYQNGVLIRSV